MKMLTAAALAAMTALTGCAMSAEGLGKSAVEDTYTSTKSPQVLAGCISSRLMGSNPAFPVDDDHWVVVRNNGYGIPIIRWDIYKTETGSRIEFRRSVAIASGEDKAATCF